MAFSILKRFGRMFKGSSVAPVSVRDEDQAVMPKVERPKGDESDEALCKKRWDNPPPGQLAGIADGILNDEFFGGEHFHRKPRYAVDASTNTLVRMRRNRPPVQVGITTAIMQDLISLQAKSVPTVGCEPMTTQESDKYAARVGQAILKEYHSSAEFNMSRAALARATQFTGLGVLIQEFDPSAGESYFIPAPPEMQEQGIAGHLAVEGALKDRVASLLNVRFDPSARQAYLAQWAMYGDIMHVDHAREFFRDYSIQPTRGLAYADFLAHSSPLYSTPADSSLWFEDAYVMVRTHYEKRSMSFPNGRYMVFVGNDPVKKIKDEENPYGNEIPFSYTSAIPRLDSPYPFTTMRFLRTLNKVFDARISQYVSDANLLGRMRLLVEKNSGINPYMLDNSSLQIIEYLPGATPPVFMPPPEFPSWVIQIIPILRELMEYIAGLPDVMKGVNPPGSRSGEMIQHLVEQAHSRFYTNFIETETAYELHGQHRLQGAQKFYTVERTIRLAGDELSDDIIQYTGADLSGSMRVKAKAGSALPMSKNLRLQQLMQLYQAQLISKDEMEEWSEFAVLEDIHKDVNAEKKLIRFEHKVIFGKQFPLMPQDDDDHEMHIRHHRRITRKPEWFSLPPQLQKLFQQHMDTHKEYQRAQFADLTGDNQAQVGTMQQLMRPRPVS